MADNLVLNAGTGGATLATDDVSSVHYQKVKIDVGGDGVSAALSNSNPLPISDAGGSVTVDGTVAVSGAVAVTDNSGSLTVDGTVTVQDGGSTISIDDGGSSVTVDGTVAVSGTVAVTDNSSSLTVDAPVGTPVFVRLSDGSSAISALPITDNAGSLTVDGTVTANLAAGTNNIGDVDVLSLPAIPAGTNNIGDVDILTIAAGDNNIGNVDIVTMPNVTLAAGTNTNEIVGDVAQDAAVAGNPVLMGGRASTATPSAMSADGDSVYNWLTRNGAQVVAGELVDDAAFTPGTSRINAIGLQADETSTDSVDEGDAGCPRMTLDRKQIVTVQAHAATGGATPYSNLDCDETEDAIKATAGKLYWIHAVNLASTKRYLKFYNATVANVTVGTTTPVLSFPIPTMGDTNGAGFTINFGAMGVQFDTAITVAATTGFADNDTGAPGANEVILNAGYF